MVTRLPVGHCARGGGGGRGRAIACPPRGQIEQEEDSKREHGEERVDWQQRDDAGENRGYL